MTNVDSSDGAVDHVDIQLLNLIIGDPDASAPVHAFVLGGGGLGTYSYSTQQRAGGQTETVNGIVTNLFGRPTVLRDIATGDVLDDLLVVYEGKRFESAEQRAVWLVLTFLAGAPGAVTAEMAVRGNAEIGRRVYAWRRPSLRARPPVFLKTFYPPSLAKLISRLCEEAKVQVERDDVHLDVALTHLFADHRDLLDLEMRDLTLALDALVESSAQSQGKATAIPSSQYALLRPRLEQAIKDALVEAGQAGGSLETRLVERLQGGNDMSVTRRRESCWSRVGIALKSDEVEALANRNAMAHSGALLRHAGDEKMQKLIFQVQMVRTLVNRSILSLLGYRGPVLNYLVGHNMAWEHFERRLPSEFGTYGSGEA
ncbi:MAG: hypothetical protein ACYDBH_14030 [Acidobacteriaceae bacterium]